MKRKWMALCLLLLLAAPCGADTNRSAKGFSKGIRKLLNPKVAKSPDQPGEGDPKESKKSTEKAVSKAGHKLLDRKVAK